ncbi:hypothetical protein C8J56DRAFT_894888 [Mycena floridula]|nr:hypothetical protein C8J56DRAFT_894888 [Mycena floridula]
MDAHERLSSDTLRAGSVRKNEARKQYREEPGTQTKVRNKEQQHEEEWKQEPLQDSCGKKPLTISTAFLPNIIHSFVHQMIAVERLLKNQSNRAGILGKLNREQYPSSVSLSVEPAGHVESQEASDSAPLYESLLDPRSDKLGSTKNELSTSFIPQSGIQMTRIQKRQSEERSEQDLTRHSDKYLDVAYWDRVARSCYIDVKTELAARMGCPTKDYDVGISFSLRRNELAILDRNSEGFG